MGVGLTLVCLAALACIMQTHSLIVMAPLRVISSPLFDSGIVSNCIITAWATVAFILEPFSAEGRAVHQDGDKYPVWPVFPPTLRSGQIEKRGGGV